MLEVAKREAIGTSVCAIHLLRSAVGVLGWSPQGIDLRNAAVGVVRELFEDQHQFYDASEGQLEGDVCPASAGPCMLSHCAWRVWV